MELGKFISITYREYQNFMREALKGYSLGNTDYPVLLVVGKNPGISLNEVSRYTSLSKSIVSRSVNKLAEDGYLEMHSDENHRQRMKLYLSEKGQKVIPYINKRKTEWQERVLKGSSAEDLDSFFRVMANIYENSVEIK